MNKPSLIIIGKRRRIPLKKGKTVIGRAPSVTVQLVEDPKVSWKHTEIVRKREGFLIRDLESTNGTLVNGKLLTQPQLLQDNDRLQIGKTAFAVDMGSGAFGAQYSTTVPPERVQQQLDEFSSQSYEPSTVRYHFDPTEPLSKRLGRAFVGRINYKSQQAAKIALGDAKRALPPIDSAYQPAEEKEIGLIQRLFEWVAPIRSQTKICEVTGKQLKPMAAAIYDFDSAEDLAQILYAWNADLLQYVPVATPEAQQQKHCTRLVLWWHREAETAYLEQNLYFTAKVIGSRESRQTVKESWLVVSLEMDGLTAQRFLDALT